MATVFTASQHLYPTQVLIAKKKKQFLWTVKTFKTFAFYAYKYFVCKFLGIEQHVKTE